MIKIAIYLGILSLCTIHELNKLERFRKRKVREEVNRRPDEGRKGIIAR